MNLILFCILFAHGYFASKTPGLAFWMLGTLFLVSVLVALNAQKPVPFAAIMDSYLGVMTGLTIGVTIARVLWPRLPQNELKEATIRFCDAAKLALDENSEASVSSINSTLLGSAIGHRTNNGSTRSQPASTPRTGKVEQVGSYFDQTFCPTAASDIDSGQGRGFARS